MIRSVGGVKVGLLQYIVSWNNLMMTSWLIAENKTLKRQDWVLKLLKMMEIC
jgi:hypothetical protein